MLDFCQNHHQFCTSGHAYDMIYDLPDFRKFKSRACEIQKCWAITTIQSLYVKNLNGVCTKNKTFRLVTEPKEKRTHLSKPPSPPPSLFAPVHGCTICDRRAPYHRSPLLPPSSSLYTYTSSISLFGFGQPHFCEVHNVPYGTNSMKPVTPVCAFFELRTRRRQFGWPRF